MGQTAYPLIPSLLSSVGSHRSTGGFSNIVGSKESRRVFVCVPVGAFIAATLSKAAVANTNMIPKLTVLSGGGEKAGLGNGDQWGALGE